ncbi:MAG: hypothetical protein U0359_27450 [Byssovorax sp.]
MRQSSWILALGALALGCGTGATGTGTTGSGGGGGGGGSGATYALSVHAVLSADAMGVAFSNTNGALSHVPKDEIVGKTYYFATTPAGESAGNTAPLEIGVGSVEDDLDFTWKTKPDYADGPWEMSMFISVAGADPMLGPQAGDIALFSLDPAPAGEPPITGTSVRMHVDGADAALTVDNSFFVRFAK